MESVIKSVLSQKDEVYAESLSLLMSGEADAMLSTQERDYITYLLDTYIQCQQMPSEEYFLRTFPEYTNTLSKASVLKIDDLNIHIRKLINDRIKQSTSLEIMKLASEVQTKGLTDDHMEKLRDLVQTKDRQELDPLSYNMMLFKDRYEEKKNKPVGLLTFVNSIDEKIGGLSPGTVNVIFAFVSHFKSTWGLNIAYNNAKKLNYNVAVISLEVQKEDIMYNLLSRHSFDPKFTKFPFVGHEKIRKCIMTEEEEEFIMNEVLEDLNNTGGKLIILDETDFTTFSFSEIRAKLEQVDDLCLAETGSGLDAVVWDYAQLFKFSDGMRGMSEGAVINMYISFIRQLSIKFRRDPITKEYRQLTSVVLAQANRDGFQQADRKNGAYNLRALSEANELERAGYRIMSIWTNENLKESREATVQLLKNRSGATMYEPQTVYADGEAYVFGDEVEGFNDMITTDDLDSLFSSGGFDMF